MEKKLYAAIYKSECLDDYDFVVSKSKITALREFIKLRKKHVDCLIPRAEKKAWDWIKDFRTDIDGIEDVTISNFKSRIDYIEIKFDGGPWQAIEFREIRLI